MKKYLRKKSPAKTLFKKSFRLAEKALILAVHRRDEKCQLCGGNAVLQMDHAIVSRRHLSTFFEIRQMVLLCRGCHMQKTFNQFGIAYKVSDLVRKREGSDFINHIQEESRKIKKWSVAELEELTTLFNGMFLKKEVGPQCPA